MRKMAAKLMKAVQYSKYGGGASSLEHVTIPVPDPKKGELLLKVEASSVNPIDWKIQKGLARPFLPRRFPFIPGFDVAGEVVSAGADVTDWAPGDKTAGCVEIVSGGGLGEYVIALPKNTTKRPPGVSAIDAAALPVAGLSALQVLIDSGVKIDGSYTGNVLVTAAAGGVGLYAVQLAKLSGAHVTATVGQRNIELVKSLGVDEVLDYKTEEGTKLLSPSGKKYDVVVNAANLKWSAIEQQLAPTAHVQELVPGVASTVSSLFKKLTGAKQKRTVLHLTFKATNLTFLLDLVTQGKLKTIVDSQYPLAKAEDAWAKSIDGHATGKIVVTTGDEF